MDGTLAFAAALTSHGNLYLRDEGIPGKDELLPAGPTLKYVSEVSFVRDTKRLIGRSRAEVAGGITEWFETMRRRGAERLSLVIGRGECHEGVLASSSSVFGVQADFSECLELWIPEWNTLKGDRGKRIWKIIVKGQSISDDAALKSTVNLDMARANLEGALKRATEFAGKSDVSTFFPEHFAEGLKMLKSPKPDPAYYPDMIPSKGYSTLARQVISGASYGWVFGGMGSWNDIWLSDDSLIHEYETVSKELRTATGKGLQDGTNSFAFESE